MDNAESLRQAILDQLTARQWRAGHRLPTERDLGEQFALSRSTVRRVLQDFKRKQLITQTVGSGTYVADNVQQVLGEVTTEASDVGILLFSGPKQVGLGDLAETLYTWMHSPRVEPSETPPEVS